MMGDPAAPRDSILGLVIDQKYVVDRVLGQGGMGLVVEAHPVDGSEPVAVKLLRNEALVVQDAITRFFLEANTLARLESKHVVRVHTVGRQDDSELPYMVMELLKGMSLADYLKQQGPLPIQEACAYICEACEAMAEAHKLNIVHRDLKPANLFRAEAPEGPCIKVIDFGIAKELDESNPRTNTRMVMGSVAHMPPEQLRAAKYAEARSDIWALGATLFELLTDKQPFRAPSLPQLIVAINCEEPRKPSELRPEIPSGLEAILLRCLSKKTDDRFASMDHLRIALNPFARGESPAPEPALHAKPDATPASDVPSTFPPPPSAAETLPEPLPESAAAPQLPLRKEYIAVGLVILVLFLIAVALLLRGLPGTA